ncbi:MAG: M1 family aminopeptidase, partial [Acidobacteriota bacterium]
SFHAEVQSIERIVIRSQGKEIPHEREPGPRGLWSIQTAKKLPAGALTLEIAFSNRFDTRMAGLFRVESAGQGFLFTQFEAIDARKAFPCWDEPIFKIPFQMRLRIPDGHEAVTNAPEESRSLSDGWKIITFRKTKPLPTYLLALATGPFEFTDIPGLSIPGRIVTLPGKSTLTGPAKVVTARLLKALETYFDIRYPYAKLDLIAIPGFPGAMENPGAITFGESHLLLDEETASMDQRRKLARVVGHELAHIWFGDMVTMAWWDDLWLNESFASWLGDKVTQRFYPRFKTDLVEGRDVQELMNRDARPSTQPVRRPVDSEAQIYEDLGLKYGKGQKILEMFERWIGPEPFRQGVIRYIRFNSWGNATAVDLWNTLSKTSGRDLSVPLSNFLDQPGIPLVTMEVRSGGTVRLHQSRFLNHDVTAPELTWKVPVRLRYKSAAGTKTIVVFLDKKKRTVHLGTDTEWIYPDAGSSGYYRWEIPTAALFYLAENSVDLLSARERIAFLGNAGALLDSAALSGADYLRVLNAFAEDPEPEVVSTLLSGLAKVEAAFIPDDLKEPFARYIRSSLQPILDRIGLEKREGEEDPVAELRAQLVEWLGVQGRDEAIRRWALQQADSYLTNPSSVHPSLAGAILRVAALEGDGKLFDTYVSRFEKTDIPIQRNLFLLALGEFTDTRLQERALEYTLKGPLRVTELLTIPTNLGNSEADHDRSFTWLMAHYDEISGRVPEWIVPQFPFFAGGCSLERLTTARSFFSEPGRQVDGTQNNLEKVADQISDCVNLRQRESIEVTSYLRSAEIVE